MAGKTPGASAAQEAWEEAGVMGVASDKCIGVYAYGKRKDGQDSLPCLAMLHPLEVHSLAKKYPESGQRRRRWVSRKKAAKLVDEPELSRLLRDFNPRSKQRRA